MRLIDYLRELSSNFQSIQFDYDQIQWYKKLSETAQYGQNLYGQSSADRRKLFHDIFASWVRTEELKAWYGAPEGESLFQGTSVSSLTVAAKFTEPLLIKNIQHLEEVISDSYIDLHNRYEKIVKDAILENVEDWIQQGLFYGFVLPSKVISQAFNLSVPQEDVIFEVDNVMVDPHEILLYSHDIREKYFRLCKDKIQCFEDLDLSQTEFEESLILADISKPKIEKYRDKILLAPVRCNEICSLISRHVTKLIWEKTDGRISPPSLMVTIYDTDTPYTYYQTGGYLGNPLAPILPGLIVQGSSGTIDAFRWLYAYRVSLVAQKIMKGSLYSQVRKEYIPFVFFGVLVPRDAEILIDMRNLGRLRYRGNLSPSIEFSYLLPKIEAILGKTDSISFACELENRIR